MTATCPNGHESKWPDWCSTCGERLAGADAAASAAASQAPAASAPVAAAAPSPLVESPPAPRGPTCDNCGVARHEHDVFCESCGYDFASGSLPEGADAAPAAGDPSLDRPGAASPVASPMHVQVSVDADFFSASVGDVDLTLPDPLPATEIVPLPGIRILIGRKSTSRGIFPEIDVRLLTDDPAVSSRHAMLERDPAGEWTLTDLGSTNGTFLTAAADEAVEAGVAHPVTPGTTFFLGAWTKIHLAATTA